MKETIRPATSDGGTPIAKAGTPNVEPFPDRIGDCVIEPRTNCEGADLRGADLAAYRAWGFEPGVFAELAEANLRGADLTGADLRKADLTGADLRQANLTNANLADTTLYQADLREADLTGANLTFADIEETKLEAATFCNTTMPDGSVNDESCP